MKQCLDSELITCVMQLFQAVGVSQSDARQVATHLVDADRQGQPSHGVMMVELYLKRLQAGSVNATSQPVIVCDAGAVVLMDAQHCLGQISAEQGMQVAIGKAQALGIGLCTVRHAFHLGLASTWASMAGAHDMIGIAMANTRPLMPAPGGGAPVVGNNPLAIAMPGRHPVVLDMAMSAAAMGKIRHAAQSGHVIPDTWATDAAGIPTTDPQEAISGMLLPVGGAKGFGLALMVDLLTGGLSGGGVGASVNGLYADPAVPYGSSQTFIAINAELLGTADALLASVDQLSGAVHDSHGRVPGERTAALRGSGGHRITLSDAIAADLADACRRLDVPGCVMEEVA